MKDDCTVLPILTTSLIHLSLKGWEDVVFEPGSHRVNGSFTLPNGNRPLQHTRLTAWPARLGNFRFQTTRTPVKTKQRSTGSSFQFQGQISEKVSVSVDKTNSVSKSHYRGLLFAFGSILLERFWKRSVFTPRVAILDTRYSYRPSKVSGPLRVRLQPIHH